MTIEIEPSEKFQNKYCVKSARLKKWNYSSEGAYFITICLKNCEYFFGEIVNGKMQLSRIGIVVDKYWREIPKHFPSVILDEYIIMPNHVHGIIMINHNNNSHRDVAVRRDVAVQRLYRERPKNYKMSMISPKSQSLSAIIRSYKSICTKTINKMQNQIFFAWQSRFYDRIIRDDNELNRIREYIFINPSNWMKDCNNPENLLI
ncbi:transposase [bacterium (Candidatus Torokbacteria) CG09_land_8_20_14_0_10_42_11]|nr:MAG: transposase [bacterium (Candidatus Torokbacteria) CG09_land_8_20_14_0_10_42_11]